MGSETRVTAQWLCPVVATSSSEDHLDTTRTSTFNVAKHEESDCRVASAHLRKDGEFVNFDK